jgi:catechol 2,3-dioxygenase
MPRLPDAQLSHVGLYVDDLARAKAFYTRIFGLVVTDEGKHTGREFAFLSRNANEHHQLVLAYIGPRKKGDSSLNQLSFRIGSLEDLQIYWGLLAKEQVEGLEGRDHGNSWSLYFFDPEGNKIEMYVPTPWHVSQPWREPLDLLQPAADIRGLTERRVKADPSYRPMTEWAADLSRRLAN